MKEDDYPDFSGKCLSISLVDDTSNHDLIDPHFEIQAGRLFVVGTVPQGASDSDWVADCQGAVARYRVFEYFVFDSLEAYTSAVKKSEDAQKENDE